MNGKGMVCLLCTLALAASAQAVPVASLVECVGQVGGESGGPLGLDYCYKITLPMMDFFGVATHAGSGAGFTNVAAVDEFGTSLAGWFGGWQAIPDDDPPDFSGFTPHGGHSTPDGTCEAGFGWEGPALGAGVYYLGFDHGGAPHDASWLAEVNDAEVATTDWYSSVGDGFGPVHSPVPEPMTLSLLGLGAIGLLRRRRNS